MQKISMVINGFLVLCVLFVAGCMNPQIVVRGGTPATDLRTYRAASVLSYSDDWNSRHERISGRGDTYINDKITSALDAGGIPKTVDENKADLDVDCHYRTGWCLPYMGRHFDVFFSSLHTINIKLIDRMTKKVIGEVEYRRPRFTSRPPEDFVDAMFSELMGKKIISRWSDGTPINVSY